MTRPADHGSRRRGKTPELPPWSFHSRDQKGGVSDDENVLAHLATANAPDLISVHSPDGRCLYASGDAAVLLGMPADALRGRRLSEFARCDDTRTLDEELRSVIGQETRRFRYKLEAVDGSMHWAETRLRNAEGFLVAVTRNIDDEINRQTAEWERLKLEARTDFLTQLQNRFGLEETLDSELSRCLRTRHGFSVALFDVDRFKVTNDTWGHAYGDRVLRRIASVIGCGRRCYDVLGRWGGDEFLLILPETGVEEAKAVAQRMTAAVAAEFTQKSDPVQVTVSAGVTDSSGCMIVDRIIERADHAMYRAKAQGGNCVATFEPAETLVPA